MYIAFLVDLRNAMQHSHRDADQFRRCEWTGGDASGQRPHSVIRHRKHYMCGILASVLDWDYIAMGVGEHRLRFLEVSRDVPAKSRFLYHLDREHPAKLKIEGFEDLGVHTFANADLVLAIVFNRADDFQLAISPYGRADADTRIASLS
jgi:hypothetical protein